MKKLLALILALVMCFSLVACGGDKKDDAKKDDAANAGDEKVLKVGVLEPQTGGSSFVGLNQIAGIKAALADWEEHYGNPGGYKIELVIGDSQSSADVGVTEAERLITSEGCKAIIGTYNSGVAASVAPVCIKYKVPFMVVNAVADNIMVDNSNYVFRANVGDTVSADNGWEYNLWLDDLMGGRKMAYIYDSGDWGTGSHSSNLATWEQRGATWEVVYEEAVNTGITDFSTIITKIKNSGANFVSTALYLDECILLCRQLKEQNLAIIMTGAGGFMSADFLPAIGKDADYTLVSGSWVYDPTQLGEDALQIEKDFLAANKDAVSVDEPFANGWLGMYCLLNAIDDCKSDDNEKIAAALDAMDLENKDGERTFLFHPTMERVKFEDQMGVAGNMVYNQNLHATSCFCQIQDGKYVTVYPFVGESKIVTDIPAWSER